ncbi:MAG: hypothetical protein IKU29_03800 [Parabacteroides sp.]|nr:hypothetical protein [Parabacteroides sp.]
MRPERIRFELNVICDRINERVYDYEKGKSIYQEHIVSVKYNEDTMCVIVRFNTYLYKIYYDETCYILAWYRQDENDSKKYIKDGFKECDDLSKVIQLFDECLYGSLCPYKPKWWKLHKRPKKYECRRTKKWA